MYGSREVYGGRKIAGNRTGKKAFDNECYQKGKTAEMIAEFMELPLEEVERIIKHCEKKE